MSYKGYKLPNPKLPEWCEPSVNDATLTFGFGLMVAALAALAACLLSIPLDLIGVDGDFGSEPELPTWVVWFSASTAALTYVGWVFVMGGAGLVWRPLKFAGERQAKAYTKYHELSADDQDLIRPAWQAVERITIESDPEYDARAFNAFDNTLKLITKRNKLLVQPFSDPFIENAEERLQSLQQEVSTLASEKKGIAS